jgi:hypothetical protein
VLAPADAAAQLVELREAEALGALNQHHRCVGDVDADLDHRGRHHDVRLSRREALHRTRLLFGGHLAVQQCDAEAAELGSGEPLRLGLGGLRLNRLGIADQRTDDVGLAALTDLPADELVGLRPVVLPHHPGADRLSSLGQLAQRGRIQIAVGGQ